MTTAEVYPVAPTATGSQPKTRSKRARLGTTGSSSTPPPASEQVRQEKRQERHALKRAQRAFTDSKSSRLCWTTSGAVSIDVGRSLVAHVSGVHRCGSPWACPVCAPVIRQRRAGEIDQALSLHLAAGGGAEFVTLTARHHRADSLSSRLDVVAEALKLTLSGSPWARRRSALGFLGAIRTTEVTWGEANGWHPHCHALFLFDRPLSKAERVDLEEWLFGRWGGVCKRKGLGSITRANGVDVRAVHGAGELGDYLTKVEGGWSAGAELSRTDLKTHAPIALLRELVATGDRIWLGRWLEYERATFDKRAIRWTPGLRGRLLGVEAEASNTELAASEGADLALLRAIVGRDVWHGHLRDGTTGELLTELEQCAALLLVLSDLVGTDLDPIGVPR